MATTNLVYGTRRPLAGAAAGKPPRQPLAGAAAGAQPPPIVPRPSTSGHNVTVGSAPLTASIGANTFDPNYAAAVNASLGGGGYGGGGFVPMERPNLGALQQTEIDTAMAAIQAKYGAARKELRLDKDLLALDFHADKRASRNTEEQDIQIALNDFAGRGMARSGFAGRELAGIATTAAGERAGRGRVRRRGRRRFH